MFVALLVFRADFFYVFSVLCLLCLCTHLFICTLWSRAGKGMTSWLSFVVYNCEFVTFPVVSWVRCVTWLYRFLIVAPLFTFRAHASESAWQCFHRTVSIMHTYNYITSILKAFLNVFIRFIIWNPKNQCKNLALILIMGSFGNTASKDWKQQTRFYRICMGDNGRWNISRAA